MIAIVHDLDTAVLEVAQQLTQQGQEITLRGICRLLEPVAYKDVKASVWRMRNRCIWPIQRPRGLVAGKAEVLHRIATQPREEFLHRAKLEPDWLPPLGHGQPLEQPVAMAMYICGRRWEHDDEG